MFWDHVAWIYDVFANGVNRKANRALCATVEATIHPGDDVLECACGTGLLSGVIAGKCKSLGLYDLTPALCHLDYTMSDAGGASSFVREYTLASGGPYCDCGYKRKAGK